MTVIFPRVSLQHPVFLSPESSSLLLPVLPVGSLSFRDLEHRRSAMATSVRIVIVGDVHDDWDLREDSSALHLLQPDLVLFTGDFGNENVELVRSISNLDFPKAAILGNHDCWGTYDFQQKKKTLVQLQLQSLGKQHVGYSRLDMPALKLSIVGGRPFSSGGDKLFRPKLLSQRLGKQHVGYSRLDMPALKLSIVGGRPFSSGGDKLFRPKLLSQRYGVRNLEESKKKIINAASGAPDGHNLVFLAHSGPSGLGSKTNDICGRDWVVGGGDHGDSDLAQALLELSKRLPIPLVVFGHMHKGLAYGGLRKMIVVGDDGTIYLNGAIVPRVKSLRGRAGSSETSNEFHQGVGNEDGSLRAFSVVDIEKGRVEKISETWVLVTSKRTALEQESILFQRP